MQAEGDGLLNLGRLHFIGGVAMVWGRPLGPHNVDFELAPRLPSEKKCSERGTTFLLAYAILFWLSSI